MTPKRPIWPILLGGFLGLVLGYFLFAWGSCVTRVNGEAHTRCNNTVGMQFEGDFPWALVFGLAAVVMMIGLALGRVAANSLAARRSGR